MLFRSAAADQAAADQAAADQAAAAAHPEPAADAIVVHLSDDNDFYSVTTASAHAVYGHEGDDAIFGGSKDDYLSGAGGDDLLVGDYGSDVILGGDGNDGIFGGGLDDRIFGDAGDDSITGDGGSDQLTGGAGADTFAWEANDLAHGYLDHVTDFEVGVDKIDLTEFLASSGATAYEDVVRIVDDQGAPGTLIQGLVRGEWFDIAILDNVDVTLADLQLAA